MTTGGSLRATLEALHADWTKDARARELRPGGVPSFVRMWLHELRAVLDASAPEQPAGAPVSHGTGDQAPPLVPGAPLVRCVNCGALLDLDQAELIGAGGPLCKAPVGCAHDAALPYAALAAAARALREARDALAAAVAFDEGRKNPDHPTTPMPLNEVLWRCAGALAAVTRALEGATPALADWTEGADGRSNSSPLYLALVSEVARLIRSSAHDLIAGRATAVAGLIVAQLAHVHRLAPATGATDARRRCHRCGREIPVGVMYTFDGKTYYHTLDCERYAPGGEWEREQARDAAAGGTPGAKEGSDGR